MGLEKFIEEQINKAMNEGLFDNLTGTGKPINLDAYFNTPEDLRIVYSLLKNGDFIPEELRLLKEIETLKEKLAVSADDEKKKIMKEINEKQLSFDLMKERYKRRR
jgi:hypothetical protein